MSGHAPCCLLRGHTHGSPPNCPRWREPCVSGRGFRASRAHSESGWAWCRCWGPWAGGSQGWPWLCWTQGILGALGVRPRAGGEADRQCPRPKRLQSPASPGHQFPNGTEILLFLFFVSCVCDASFCKCKEKASGSGGRGRERQMERQTGKDVDRKRQTKRQTEIEMQREREI